MTEDRPGPDYRSEERFHGGQERDWDRDRYGSHGGGFGQGSAGGFNESHMGDYEGGYAGRGSQERDASGDSFNRGRSDRGYPGGGRGSSQYDRGGFGSGSPQYGGGGTSSAGSGSYVAPGQHSPYGQNMSRPYSGPYGGTTGRMAAGRVSQGPGAPSGWSGAPGHHHHAWTGAGVGTGELGESWERNHDRDRDWDRNRHHESGGLMESIGRFFGFGPKNYKRSDERLTEEINDRLYRHPEIDATEIEVSVKDGEATLTGQVEDRRAKFLVEEVCVQILGVKDVHNQLRVSGNRGQWQGQDWNQSPTSWSDSGQGGHYGSSSGMGGSSLGSGTTGSTGRGGTGSTNTTLGQSQTGSTRDAGDTSKKK